MEVEQKYKEYEKIIGQYVESQIDTILKEPIGFIKYPFIDPGSVYHGNVWDWDTYWSVYGLLNLVNHFSEDHLKEKIELHAKGNVLNFLDHQLEDGYIPMMIEIGKWTQPYLNMKHKEGVKMNMHKPFLCSQIVLISEFYSDYTWIKPYISKLLAYFECYDREYFNSNCELYVWHDDIMIGMDNDPSSFGRPKDSTANIFLNSFMVHEFEAMECILTHVGEVELLIREFQMRQKSLISAIQRECYDSRDCFFYSVDVDIKTRHYDWFHKGLGVFWKTLPIKVRTWSGFIPLWVGFATNEQAEELVKHIEDDKTFYSKYGVLSLAKDEKMFHLGASNNPSNWLGPIWLVVNYIVFSGLLKYGYVQQAKELCERSLLLLGEDLKETGCLHEYYNPFTGKPVMNGGFLNWNILVLNMVTDLKKY